MEIQDIEPKELTLDKRNPRFGLSEALDETEASRKLVESADLEELWNSISERGFEDFEPLVVTRENNQLIVLEGNRRLAAVKFLTNPSLLREFAPRKKVPYISPEKLKTCRKLPVVVVSSRNRADNHIGFKHVNGPARWSPLAKARFGVNFYEKLDVERTPKERLQSLTKRLGDGPALILRMLVAYKIIQQSIDLGYFDKLNVNEESIEFSHLYTLISNPDSREFLGLSRAPLSEKLIRSNPVPPSHERQLLEILDWLYGKHSVIVSQANDRPRLQRVLASTEGINELRATGSLASAETVAGLVNDDWLRALASIFKSMEKATDAAAIVETEMSEVDKKQARSFLDRMKNKLKQIEAVIPG